MVMEDPSYPEATVVGREFVRQYYTLMNKAPEYLHRFYSTKSSFIHGGVDCDGQDTQEPVYGQTEIHKKIVMLNFNECHAKIRQVDSQPTVGDAVVVQVTGELSNNRGPLRRFMQTFVLAPQNPKQYYVHNDIFRYQDEVFSDLYDSEEEVEAQRNESSQENGLDSQLHPELEPVPQPSSAVHEPVETAASPEATVPAPQPPPAHQPAHQPPTPKSPTPPTAKPAVVEEKPTEAVSVEEKPMAAEEPAAAKPAADEAPAGSKSFSWANVVNKPSGGSVSSAAVAVVTPMNNMNITPLAEISMQQQFEESATPAVEEKPQPAPTAPRSNRSSVEPNKKPPARFEGEDSSRPRRFEEGHRERRNELYPDTQQVFVGNLPHDVADLELRRFFGKYGKVVDCRINRANANNKVPFGFVVFDSEEPVKELLMLKRVEMENGHRLNVEEKKPRGERPNRPAGRGGRGGGGRNMNRSRDNRDNSDSRMDKPPGKPTYSSNVPKKM